jgi:putative aldouronate transport system substrate-binding protein
MYAGGDVPDVNWDGDPTQVRRNVRQGYVLELPYQTILRYAPTYVRYLNKYGKEAWLYSSVKGHNYGIPTFAASDVFPSAPIWRMDWLRKAGFTKPPETLDEMHRALLYFRNGDPDGDGQKDTYGMCPDVYWSVWFGEVFASFGILQQDFMFKDGKVVWGGIQPEAKQALAVLRQWYREGLIDPDFAAASDGNSPQDGKFSSGRTGYMYAYGSFSDFDKSNPNAREATMRVLIPGAELAPGKPLIGIDGKRRARVWGGPGHVIWFGKDVAKSPAKAVRVLKMFERFATNREMFLRSRVGLRGTHWNWNPQRGIILLPPYDARGEDARSLLSTNIESAYGFFSPCAIPLSETQEFLRTGEEEFRRTYEDTSWGVENAIGKSDVVPSSALYLKDLRQLQSTVFIQIITGDKPLDSFDDFVREWWRRGGETLTKEANEVAIEAKDIYRTVGAR